MKECPRPLDPVDAEAVAAGSDPVFASDAAAHALECLSCQELVRSGASLSKALAGIGESEEGLSGLSERVLRLRAFSPRERRTYALWRAPVLLDLFLGIAGIALLALPVLTASDQLSLGAVALAPLLALSRSMATWALESIRVIPSGLGALSSGLQGQTALGAAALLLLAPAAMGLRRVLSRVTARRR